MSEPPTAPAERIPVGSIWTLIFVDTFARLSYGLARTPLLPLYAAFLGAGPGMIGFVGAAGTITGIVLKLPSGVISDVLGRRPLLLFGLVIFATGPFLYLVVGGDWSLAGVRFYHGLATAIYSPVAMAAVASLAGNRRGEYLSWLSNSKILGKLLGAFLGGLILSYAVLRPASVAEALSPSTLLAAIHLRLPDPSALTGGDFGRAYLVCAFFGVIALLGGVIVLRRVKEARPEKRRSLREVGAKFAKGLREVAGDTRILLASGCEGVQNITVGVIEQFLPFYAVFVAGRSPLEAGLLYGGQTITTILAKPAFGRFSDRRGRRAVILLGMVLCAAPFAAVPWFAGFAPLFGLCLVFGLGEALVTSSSAALVGDMVKEQGLGAAMGVFGTIHDAGHALGPILGGLMIQGLAGTLGGERDPRPFRVTFGAIALLLVVYSVLFAVRTRRTGGGSPETETALDTPAGRR